MIPYVLPRIGPTDEDSFKEFQRLQAHIKKASSITGAVVSLEQDFIKDHDTKLAAISNKIIKHVGYTRSRVSTGYSILFYFTEQVRF